MIYWFLLLSKLTVCSFCEAQLVKEALVISQHLPHGMWLFPSANLLCQWLSSGKRSRLIIQKEMDGKPMIDEYKSPGEIA